MEMEMDVFWAYLLLMLGVFLFLLLVLLLISTMNKRLQLEKLRGKTILITGCDTGFGFDLVLKCVSHGMDVFAACLTEQVLFMSIILKKLLNFLLFSRVAPE
jgi:hypothetical protein